MSERPLVSVVMSTYNDGEYLRGAIQSILDQTYENFEFIIINDGSKDNSGEIVKEFKDPRIRLVERENKGLTYSLNEGIKLAQGKYVARQDGDDWSAPERFELQVAAMEADPGLGLLGSNYTIMSPDGKPEVSTHVFTHSDDLKIAEPISNQYGHGSVMMRKSVLDELGGYDATVGHAEDYDLFVRISKVARIGNIGRPLYRWRRNPAGITSSKADVHMMAIEAVRDREFDYIAAHLSTYKLYSSWHPRGYYPSARAYFDQKSALFRDLAYLYWTRGKNRPKAVWMMACAILSAPWRRRNFRMMIVLLRNDTAQTWWRFEFL